MTLTRRVGWSVMAVIVLANVGLFLPRILESRRAKFLDDAGVREYHDEWDKCEAQTRVSVAAWGGPDKSFSLDLRPQPGSKYHYVTTVDIGRQMRSVISGSLSVDKSEQDELLIVNQELKKWLIEGNRAAEVPKSEFIMTVRDGRAVFPNGQSGATSQLISDIFLPGLESLASGVTLKRGIKWPAKEDSAVAGAVFEIVGFATVDGWKTVVVKSVRNLDEAAASSVSKQGTAAMKKGLPRMAMNEATTSYVDISTGLIVRRETKMTITSRGTKKVLKTTCVTQLIADSQS